MGRMTTPPLNFAPALDVLRQQAGTSQQAMLASRAEGPRIIERGATAMQDRRLQAAMMAQRMKMEQQRIQAAQAQQMAETVRMAIVQQMDQAFRKQQQQRDIEARKAIEKLRQPPEDLSKADMAIIQRRGGRIKAIRQKIDDEQAKIAAGATDANPKLLAHWEKELVEETRAMDEEIRAGGNPKAIDFIQRVYPLPAAEPTLGAVAPAAPTAVPGGGSTWGGELPGLWDSSSRPSVARVGPATGAQETPAGQLMNFEESVVDGLGNIPGISQAILEWLGSMVPSELTGSTWSPDSARRQPTSQPATQPALPIPASPFGLPLGPPVWPIPQEARRRALLPQSMQGR